MEASINRASSHGNPKNIELVPKPQLVGEIFDVERLALYQPPRVRHALALPGPIKRHEVKPQLLHQLLKFAHQ